MAEEIENLTLYVRGMNKSPEDGNEVWDDSALNNAYDKALKIANAEVAKRIAMETNSNNTGNKSKASKGKEKAKREPQKSRSIQWTEGMPCRAIYEEDGQEYEAVIVHILDDDECIIKFIGYDNNEQVRVDSLKKSLGDGARMRQMEEAMKEARARGEDDGFESQPGDDSVDLYSDESSLLEPARLESKTKKKRSDKKKPREPEMEFGQLPTLPLPTMNMLRNMGGGTDMPFAPPPPMAALSARSDAEEQAISDMLLSWYMTGYYTGLYQGMKRQRQNRKYQ